MCSLFLCLANDALSGMHSAGGEMGGAEKENETIYACISAREIPTISLIYHWFPITVRPISRQWKHSILHPAKGELTTAGEMGGIEGTSSPGKWVRYFTFPIVGKWAALHHRSIVALSRPRWRSIPPPLAPHPASIGAPSRLHKRPILPLRNCHGTHLRRAPYASRHVLFIGVGATRIAQPLSRCPRADEVLTSCHRGIMFKV